MSRTEVLRKLVQLACTRGLSQAELARRVGMQPSHLNHFLRGHGDVRSSKLLEILLVLGVDLERHLDEALGASGDGGGETEGESWLRVFHGFDSPERSALRLLMARVKSARDERIRRSALGDR